jgi:hypothetical protein
MNANAKRSGVGALFQGIDVLDCEIRDAFKVKRFEVGGSKEEQKKSKQ